MKRTLLPLIAILSITAQVAVANPSNFGEKNQLAKTNKSFHDNSHHGQSSPESKTNISKKTVVEKEQPVRTVVGKEQPVRTTLEDKQASLQDKQASLQDKQEKLQDKQTNIQKKQAAYSAKKAGITPNQQ